MSQQLPDHIYSVMIRTAADTLILPNAAVIEVAGQERFHVRQGEPGWWIGNMSWDEVEIPVISLEMMLGLPRPSFHRKARLVLVKAMTGVLPHGKYAIASQAYPLLVTISEIAVQPVPLTEADAPELILSRVQVANRQAVIPNLEAIEARIAEET